MPYYCTVPRCTSMAGKAKNVSFHQFPRDEELAKLWNNILKRGKPYTKYSKVCSLHFKPEDYTITSAGKNKGYVYDLSGQWRTLRKDAIPSQNLPSDTPAANQRRRPSDWMSNMPNNVPAIDPQIQHQLAQAIYMQTMLAMQAAAVTDPLNLGAICNGLTPPLNSEETVPSIAQAPPQNDVSNESDQESDSHEDSNQNSHEDNQQSRQDGIITSYQCDDCSKCFKDPDVFILHKRSHKNRNGENGKENFDLNTIKPEMLKSNPILANLLKDTVEKNIFNTNLFEKQFLLSFSTISKMEDYLKKETGAYDDDCDSSISNLDDDNLVIDENVA